MKFSTKLCFFAVATSLTSPLFAQSSWYVSAKLGQASPINTYDEKNYDQVKFKFDDGKDRSISIGKTDNNYSFELEYSTRTLSGGTKYYIADAPETFTGKQKQNSIFVNAYIYPVINKSFIAFVGAGIGKTKIEWNNIVSASTAASINDGDNILSYKLILGIETKITHSLRINAAYNHIIHDNVSLTDGDTTGEFTKQNLDILNIGINYRFGTSGN
ncbi:MAG: porin family protein [Ectothiorhodospiraceae bacterium]|nr:porin family protein [Ectothiorhodospiraceae bacterium]